MNSIDVPVHYVSFREEGRDVGAAVAGVSVDIFCTPEFEFEFEFINNTYISNIYDDGFEVENEK